MSKNDDVQAQLSALQAKYDAVVGKRSEAEVQVENLYKKLKECEVDRDARKAELEQATTELEAQTKQNSEAVKQAELDRISIEESKNTARQAQATLQERTDKFNDAKKSDLAVLKKAMAQASEHQLKALSLEGKLNLKDTETKAIKRHLDGVVRLIVDISRECGDQLPEGIRERLNNVPIDELLQIAKPKAEDADSDDDDVETVDRLMNADTGYARGAARGRGNRGTSRRRSQSSMGVRAVVDDKIHEAALARKLNRIERESDEAAPSDRAANSVMGKKTETVREQQERQKGGRKDKIAEMKKIQTDNPVLHNDDVDDALVLDQSDAVKKPSNGDDAHDASPPSLDDSNRKKKALKLVDLGLALSDSDDEKKSGEKETIGGGRSQFFGESSLCGPVSPAPVPPPVTSSSGMDDILEPASTHQSVTEKQPENRESTPTPKAMVDEQQEKAVEDVDMEKEEEEEKGEGIEKGDEKEEKQEKKKGTNEAMEVDAAGGSSDGGMEKKEEDDMPTPQSIVTRRPSRASRVSSPAASSSRQRKDSPKIPKKTPVKTRGQSMEEPKEKKKGSVASKRAESNKKEEKEENEEKEEEEEEEPVVVRHPKRGRSANSKMSHNDDTVIAAVGPKTRSKSSVNRLQEGDVPAVDVEPKTPRKTTPKTPFKPVSKTPAKTQPMTPAKPVTKTPVKTQPKTPARVRSHTPAPTARTPKTPVKRVSSDAQVEKDGLIAARLAEVPRTRSGRMSAKPAAASMNRSKTPAPANRSRQKKNVAAAAEETMQLDAEESNRDDKYSTPPITPKKTSDRMDWTMADPVPVPVAPVVRTARPAFDELTDYPELPEQLLEDSVIESVPSSSSRAVTPPTQLQQLQSLIIESPQPSSSAASAAVAALPVKTSQMSEPPSLKRKMPVDAMKSPSAREATTSHAAAEVVQSDESRLISLVLAVCCEKESVEKAVELAELDKMTMEEIVKGVCKALTELPQSNMWNVVLSKMTMEEESMKLMENGDWMIPNEEILLFKFLLSIRDVDRVLSAGLFDCFYGEFYKSVFPPNEKGCTSAADVARNMRLIFSFLTLTEGMDKEEEARKVFHEILQKKSPQAVCQSLTYLVGQSRTTSLASMLLATELDDDENGGRLISLHMSNKKYAEVLWWAIDQFADTTCKAVTNAAFKEPATSDMVQGWWESDMKLVEVAGAVIKSIEVNRVGTMVVDDNCEKLIARMLLLISPQFRIDGLDRVYLLTQLVVPAIDVIDRLTDVDEETDRYYRNIWDHSRKKEAEGSTPVSHPFLEGEKTRPMTLKLHIALAVLRSFYDDGLPDALQRESIHQLIVTWIERANNIFYKPCSDVKGNETNWLELGITGLKYLVYTMEFLVLKECKDTTTSSSDETSPAKKRPKTEMSTVAQDY